MAAPAIVPLLATGGRMAMQYLPRIMGGFSALEGLRTGGIPGAILGGGTGYLTGMGLKAPLGGLTKAGMRAAPGLATQAVGAVAPDMVDLPGLGGTATKVAKIGIPLAAAAIAAPALSRLAGGVGGGVSNLLGAPLGGAAQTAAGLLGYRPDGSPIYGGANLPAGMGQYGPTDPYGSPLDVLGSSGMGRRLETVKSAEAQRDAMRTLLPEVYKAAEATKKSDFERQAAMKGIAQNIATRAAMLQNAQAAGLQMGGTAAQQAGQALTQLYQYQ